MTVQLTWAPLHSSSAVERFSTAGYRYSDAVVIETLSGEHTQSPRVGVVALAPSVKYLAMARTRFRLTHFCVCGCWQLAVPTSPVPTNDALVQTAPHFGGARGGRVSGVLATAGASRRCRR